MTFHDTQHRRDEAATHFHVAPNKRLGIPFDRRRIDPLKKLIEGAAAAKVEPPAIREPLRRMWGAFHRADQLGVIAYSPVVQTSRHVMYAATCLASGGTRPVSCLDVSVPCILRGRSK